MKPSHPSAMNTHTQKVLSCDLNRRSSITFGFWDVLSGEVGQSPRRHVCLLGSDWSPLSLSIKCVQPGETSWRTLCAPCALGSVPGKEGVSFQSLSRAPFSDTEHSGPSPAQCSTGSLSLSLQRHFCACKWAFCRHI